MALLHLAAATRLPSPLALTVDHGLRAASTGEARFVADACAQAGIEHRTVRLERPPASGRPAWARGARHDAMRRAAGPGGIVLVGHTADDVAETVLMRAARGPGPGLAGIAPATLVDRTWFYRPLLRESRAALRDWLAARGHCWLDDPTNADPAHERACVRACMTARERDDALIGASRCARARATLSRRTADDLAGRLRLDGYGAGTTAAVEEWRSIRSRWFALHALLPRVAGRAHAPPVRALVRAVRMLNTGRAFTVGGCRLLVDEAVLRVARDPRARVDTGPRLVPSFDWDLHRAIDPGAPAPPVPLPRVADRFARRDRHGVRERAGH